MDFTLNEQQHAVAELAAEVLAAEVDLERPLGHGGYDEQVWAALAKAGLLAIALPNELGGDDLGVADVALLLTEVGKTAAQVPAMTTLALGALPIIKLGTAQQRAELLPDIASGNTVLTAAVHESSNPLALRPSTNANRSKDGWVLSGVKTKVPYAASSSTILVPAATNDGSGVFLVDPETDGVSVIPSPTASSSAECTVHMEDVLVAERDVLSGDSFVDSVEVLLRYATLGAIATGDGALAGALRLTTDYVGARKQFDKPLAAFQAVAQQIADVYIASRTVHLAALSAAWRLDAELESDSELAIAGFWFADQAPRALHTCHHLHGGAGVDITYPLHHYFSSVRDTAHFMGCSATQLERLGELAVV